jgi:hypothetical protein
MNTRLEVLDSTQCMHMKIEHWLSILNIFKNHEPKIKFMNKFLAGVNVSKNHEHFFKKWTIFEIMNEN